MVDGLMFFAYYGYYSGGYIGDMLNQWYQYGFFTYLLPFLLIFALVFGILNRLKLFGPKDDAGRGANNAVNAIIALTVGLMALQFDFVPLFFSEIFPRLGVALSILLSILILTGLFLDPEEKWMMFTLFGIGAIIVIIVLVQSAGNVGWYSGYWWRDNWPVVAGAVFFLTVIGIIVGSANPPQTRTSSQAPISVSLRP
ncbi:MAG: hypothetical protein AABX30_03680 [Nanoarchaeota archaeon]